MREYYVRLSVLILLVAASGGCLDNRNPRPVPGVWSKAAEEALERALEASAKAATEVKAYTCRFYRHERKGGQLGTKQIADVKFRCQPYSLYMGWIDPMKFGAEILYVQGRNDDTVFARQGGVLFLLPPVRLKLDDKLLEQHSRHKVTDFNQVPKTLLADVRRARQGEGLQARLLEPAEVRGEPVEGYEMLLPDVEGYYARRVSIWFHPSTRLVARLLAHNNRDELLEDYVFVQYNLNPGLTDGDFDPNNRNYRF